MLHLLIRDTEQRKLFEAENLVLSEAICQNM